MAKKAAVRNGINIMNKKLKIWIKNKDWPKIEQELAAQEMYIIDHKKQIEHEKEGIKYIEHQLEERNKFLTDFTKKINIDIDIEETNIHNLREALNRKNPKKPEDIPLVDRMLQYQDEKGEPAFDKDKKITLGFRDWELIVFKGNLPLEIDDLEETPIEA